MFIVATIQIDEYLNTNFAVSKGTVSLGCVLSEIVSRFSEQDKPDLQSIKPEHTRFTVYSARYVPDYYVQSGVIFTPRSVPD